MFEKEIDYYRRRAAEERAIALKSENRDVAAIHEELAKLYQALVDDSGLRPKLSIVSTARVSF